MTTEIIINRNNFYLTIDNLFNATNNGYIEHDNKFVAFVKTEPANAIVLGEQVKSEDGNNLVFNSVDEAKAYVLDKLSKTIYPPNFLHPISEIKHKRLVFDIGEAHGEGIRETVTGEIIECTLASNSPFLPVIAKILTDDRTVKRFSFMEIKRIRRS